MAFLPGIVKSVLQADNSYLRFEDFCRDLFYSAEGIELAPTSITRDAGRDARAVLLSLAPTRPVLCVTTTPDIDEKVTKDMIRLMETTKSDEIIYCFSKSLTEEKCISIEKKIRELYPPAKSVRVLGQIQIVGLIEHNEDIFQKHYAAEIRNVEHALLLREETTPDVAELGLRLALCTQAGNDATALRKELTRCLLLTTLADRGNLTLSQLTSAITHQLHLPVKISDEYMMQVLSQLSNDGLVSIHNDLLQITDSAKDYLQNLSEQVGVRLLEGREAIRNEIQRLSGHKLDDLHFQKIWDVFQDGIAQLFYSHGLHIIRMVRSILGKKYDTSTEDQAYFPIEHLADRIATFFSDSTQASEVRQSIIDMFTEKDSPAFQWLTQVCSIFVMMCSLGLETLSSKQIIKVLSTYHLVPDTDIVISLICDGENNHEEVNQIIKGWEAISGNIHIAKPVLEEVAYHAWISEYDYSYFGSELSQLSDEKAKYDIENAFVRTFRKVAGELTAPKYWNHFINQYKGEKERDFTRIYQLLYDQFQFKLLPEPQSYSESLKRRIMDFMINTVSQSTHVEPENLDFRVINKTERDIELLLSVLSQRKSQADSPDLATTCIISSASLLKDTGSKFRNDFGEPEMVVSTSVLAFLLTLVPQVRMNIGTLRSVLFDTSLASRLTSAQRYAYRIITTSLERDLPWSKRVTLQRELGEVLLQDAHAMGEPVSKLYDRFSRAKDQGYVAKVVVNVLDRLALTTKTQQELIQTKAKLRTVEAEFEAFKLSRSTTAVQKPKRRLFKAKSKKP